MIRTDDAAATGRTEGVAASPPVTDGAATAAALASPTGALSAESVPSAIGMPECSTVRETVRPSMARFEVGHHTSAAPRIGQYYSVVGREAGGRCTTAG